MRDCDAAHCCVMRNVWMYPAFDFAIWTYVILHLYVALIYKGTQVISVRVIDVFSEKSRCEIYKLVDAPRNLVTKIIMRII